MVLVFLQTSIQREFRQWNSAKIIKVSGIYSLSASSSPCPADELFSGRLFEKQRYINRREKNANPPAMNKPPKKSPNVDLR